MYSINKNTPPPPQKKLKLNHCFQGNRIIIVSYLKQHYKECFINHRLVGLRSRGAFLSEDRSNRSKCVQFYTRLRDCLRLAEFQLDKFGFLHEDKYSTYRPFSWYSTGRADYRARMLFTKTYKKTGPFKSQLHWIISHHEFARANRTAQIYACPKILWQIARYGIVTQYSALSFHKCIYIKYYYNIIFYYDIMMWWYEWCIKL